MKRLVQVVPHYSPPYVGGMEMRARDRAAWLASSGWAVETLTSSGLTYPHTVAEAKPAGGTLTVRYLPSREVAHTPIIFSLPVALAKAPRESVVHLEAALALSPEVAAFVCRLRKMPFVVRHALETEGHTKLRDALLRWYQHTVLRWVYQGAAIVIVLTPDDIPVVADKYRVARERIRVIPNATTLAPAESHRTAPHDPLRLLFAGRVDMQKNVPLLLRSLRRFLDTYSLPVHLDIAGDGEDMPQVRRLISELSLREHVDLKGFVHGQEFEQLYESVDALVLTSTRETFGQVILEAMVKGVPVIASNIRCVRTIVADGTSGLLADLDEHSFASAIYRLVAEDGLYEKLSRGALECAGSYSMAATMDAYIAAYAEIQRP
jgi:glycosyltransferase involved in cell wall biosynthesis